MAPPKLTVRWGDEERVFDFEGWRLEELPERPGVRVVDLRLGWVYDFYAIGATDEDPTEWALLHLDSAVVHVDEIEVMARGVRWGCEPIALGPPREKVEVVLREGRDERVFPVLSGELRGALEPFAFCIVVQLAPSFALVFERSGWSLYEEGRVVAVNPTFQVKARHER